MAEIRLDELLWSDKALIKVARHGLTPSEIYDAVILDPNRELGWVEDETHGSRLMAMGVCESNNKKVLAYLDPVNEFDGIWAVKTAWRVD